MYKQDLALDNLQGLICHKHNKPTNPPSCMYHMSFYVIQKNIAIYILSILIM